MAPPNVKGWPGGETWINTTTLLARKQYLDRVTRAGDVEMPAMATGARKSVFVESDSQNRALSPRDVADDDNARDVPDISFAASPDHDGYLLITSGALVAIGGITRANCRSVIEAGADSVAVISDLLLGPRKSAEEFFRILR